jgi:hypothetical protein
VASGGGTMVGCDGEERKMGEAVQRCGEVHREKGKVT